MKIFFGTLLRRFIYFNFQVSKLAKWTFSCFNVVHTHSFQILLLGLFCDSFNLKIMSILLAELFIAQDYNLISFVSQGNMMQSSYVLVPKWTCFLRFLGGFLWEPVGVWLCTWNFLMIWGKVYCFAPHMPSIWKIYIGTTGFLWWKLFICITSRALFSRKIPFTAYNMQYIASMSYPIWEFSGLVFQGLSWAWAIDIIKRVDRRSGPSKSKCGVNLGVEILKLITKCFNWWSFRSSCTASAKGIYHLSWNKGLGFHWSKSWSEGNASTHSTWITSTFGLYQWYNRQKLYL